MADQPVTLARNAMATRFELVLYGRDQSALRAAGQEALDEIERLEAQLSRFIPQSDVSDLNARAATESVRVEPRLFALLERCVELSRATEGAFDITVAPLIRFWNSGPGPDASEQKLRRCLDVVGVNHLQLDRAGCAVRYDRAGVEIDLGSIGKGYAIDQAASLLIESGVTSALIHGGSSTVYGLGAPRDEKAWRVAIRDPSSTDESVHCAEVELRDRALSVSAPHGRLFRAGDKQYGHVIDPRTGAPASTLLAAVTHPSAAESDGLSTALLVRGSTWRTELRRKWPETLGIVVSATADGNRIEYSNV